MRKLPSIRIRKRGITLLEMIVALVIIGAVLLPLWASVRASRYNFWQAQRGTDGPWIANMIMSTLVSERLPQYPDEEDSGTIGSDQSALITEEGTVREFLEEIGYGDGDYFSEAQLEIFERWRYEWTKEIVLVNEEGSYYSTDSDTSSRPVPDFGQEDYEDRIRDESGRTVENTEPTPEELAELPAARVIRITLKLYVPATEEAGEVDEDVDYEEGDLRGTEAGDPNVITLVTFVDADDFRPEEAPLDEDAQPVDPNADNGNNGGANNGGNNTGNGNTNNGGNTNTGGGN